MVLVYLLTAIVVASTTALSALLTGATFGTALWLYSATGMIVLLGLPLLMKGYEMASSIALLFRTAESKEELRLIEYQHPGS
ncbi:MAG: hypothetical protein AB3N13_05885 [Arenibacterium sp.]